MFTGIVERTGRIVSLVIPQAVHDDPVSSITQLIVDPGKDFSTNLGDSVAINGCCLTVTTNKMDMLTFDVSSETLGRTALGKLKEGDLVNMERAMKLGERLGGHLVSGHVDVTGHVEAIKKQVQGWHVVIALPHQWGKYCIEKGSITVDGVSLTINEYEDTPTNCLVHLMLIPTTVNLTRFKDISPGDIINIEVDLIGKYVERLLRR